MRNLRNKTLRNGALIAMDYQTGEILAYQGSADPTATRGTKRFQPRFDVLADGWRQPGSAFKPIVYASGHRREEDHRGDDVHGRRHRLRRRLHPDRRRQPRARPRPRPRRPPVLAQHPGRQGGRDVIGNDTVQAKSEAMGIQFRDGKTDAGPRVRRSASRRSSRATSSAPTARSRNGGVAGPPDDDRVASTDDTGEEVAGTATAPKPEQVLDPGAAGDHDRHPGRQHRPAREPVLGRVPDHRGRTPPARDPQDRHQQRRARTSTPTATSAPPARPSAEHGEYALAVGAWNGNSDNSLVSTRQRPAVLDRRHDLRLAGLPPGRDQGLEHQRLQPARRPDATAEVDPWTGLPADRRQAGDRAVPAGHRRRRPRSPASRAAARRSSDSPASRSDHDDVARGRPRLARRGPRVAPASGAAPRAPRTGVLLQQRASCPTAPPGARSWASAPAARAPRRPPRSIRAPRWIRWRRSTRSPRSTRR